MTYGYEAPAGASANEMLDGGASGLQYFEHYLPKYQKVHDELGLGAGKLPSPSYLYAKYDQERDMELASLGKLLVALIGADQAAGTEYQAQISLNGALAKVWPEGEAADIAKGKLGQQLGRANEDLISVKKVQAALSAAIGALHQLVAGKAAVVSIYWHPKNPDIDGASRSEIDLRFGSAKKWKLHLDEGLALDESDNHTYKKSYEWFRDVFCPHVEQTVADFLSLCERTKTDITGTYGVLVAELNKLSDSAYPGDGDLPLPGQPAKPSTKDQALGTNPSTPGVSTPGASTPGPEPSSSPRTADPAKTTPSTVQTPPPTTTPATTTPSTTTTSSVDGLAALSQVTKQLSSTASSLNTALTQGLTTLTGVIKDGVDKSIEQLKNTLDPKQADKTGDHTNDADKGKDGKPQDAKTQGSKPVAEFDLAGKHLKIEVGADGQPKLLMSGDDGKPHEFKLAIDQHGNPVIKMDDPKDVPKPDTAPEKPKPADTTHNPGQPANQPGTSLGAPPATRREEDGQHRPQPMPQGTQPEKPFDSGAQLAEAGPL
ncbi:hypothetical protein [Nocardia sp. NPDC052566]|uniref:hypothetical protein n=1 Tax=Nocardia sp. NPDC052566 TaxID=3364330 RepID=UPI0037CB0F92